VADNFDSGARLRLRHAPAVIEPRTANLPLPLSQLSLPQRLRRSVLLVWNEAREEGKMQDIARMLRRQGMPAKEIREILITNDGELIRRHLELHRERLDERLADERRAVADLERDLIEAAAPPCPTA
jgi:hypothetical protein